MATVSVYNMEGSEVGKMDLNDNVFAANVNEHLMHMAAVLQLANKRQGTQKGAIKSALTSRVNEEKFFVLDSLKFDEIKTKKMVNVLDSLKVEKALVVLDGEDNANVALSARNIAGVRVVAFNAINVYDILKYDTVVATKNAVEKIEEVYA